MFEVSLTVTDITPFKDSMPHVPFLFLLFHTWVTKLVKFRTLKPSHVLQKHFEVLPDIQRTAKNQGRVLKNSGGVSEKFHFGLRKEISNFLTDSFLFLPCSYLFFIFILCQSPLLPSLYSLLFQADFSKSL